MAISRDIPDLQTLLQRKYGSLGTPRRNEFHREAYRQSCQRKRKGGHLIRRGLAWSFKLLRHPWRKTRKLTHRLRNFRELTRRPGWLVGQTGWATTKLNAHGEVEILGKVYTAYTLNRVISPMERIRVVDWKMGDLIVEPVNG